MTFLNRNGGTYSAGYYTDIPGCLHLPYSIFQSKLNLRYKKKALRNIICLQEFSRRSKYWEDPANDPRWNKDQFQFSPKLGRQAQASYERLNTSSSINASLASGLGSSSSSRNISGLARWCKLEHSKFKILGVIFIMIVETQSKSRWKFQPSLLKNVEINQHLPLQLSRIISTFSSRQHLSDSDNFFSL